MVGPNKHYLFLFLLFQKSSLSFGRQ